MKLKVERIILSDVILCILTIIQGILLIVGKIEHSWTISSIVHFNLYMIIGLEIVTLILKDAIRNFLAMLFFICFFIFLMGQKLFMPEKNVFLTFVRTELNIDQYYVFLSIMTIGLIVTYYSYLFFASKMKVNNGYITHNENTAKPILPLIRLLFWLTLPFALYMQIKIVLVRSSLSYVSGYLINVDISFIVKIIYYLFSNFTLIYLAAKPSKIETKIIIIVLLITEGGMQLLQGRRALFATTLFFLIWYLIKYNRIAHVNYKYIFGAMGGGLLLIILFFAVEMRRSNIEVKNYNILSIVEKFMISTGGSDSVIANTIVRVGDFPKPKVWYLIDPLINNPIFVILFRKNGISQGKVYLEKFNTFSHWISYLTEASLYESGHGMGSCYLAEVYAAFGIAGVIGLSVIIGYVINGLSKIHLDGSIFKNSMIFVMVKNLFTLPRSGLFDFVSDLSYLLVALVIIYPIYYKYCGRKLTERL